VEQQRPAVKKIGAQYYNGFKFFPAFTCDQPIFPRDNKKITDVEAIRQKIATKNLKKREKKEDNASEGVPWHSFPHAPRRDPASKTISKQKNRLESDVLFYFSAEQQVNFSNSSPRLCRRHNERDNGGHSLHNASTCTRTRIIYSYTALRGRMRQFEKNGA
jgi:hypothetical protein